MSTLFLWSGLTLIETSEVFNLPVQVLLGSIFMAIGVVLLILKR